MPSTLVTGASSGIGLATAEAFASQGYDVYILARSKDKLERLAHRLAEKNPKGKFLAIRCDVSRRAELEGAAELLEKATDRLNVLVNNAGAFEYAPFEKAKPEKIDEQIDVNLKGVIYATQVFLPFLHKAATAGESAKIVNVSSIGGLWGFSNMAVYTASKFGVTGFSSALRRELLPKGIDVASIHPGAVRTKEVKPGTPKKPLTMMPDEIARQIVHLAESKSGRKVSHAVFSVLDWVERLSPSTVDKVLRKLL